MSVDKKLVLIQTPKGEPGFLGAGHIARPVIQRSFADSDPFLLLMDDFLDKQDDEPVGGPHPHAGFETVSLLLEGEVGDEAHVMKGGDLQLMTAGRGVVHTETIAKKAKMRLLQLWLNLPKKDRNATPRVQDIALANVPFSDSDGVSIRLYSGSLAGLTSPVLNYTPLIIADLNLEAGVSTTLELPASYNGFIYVIDGAVLVGKDAQMLDHDQVGWLNHVESKEISKLELTAGTAGVRFILYAGEPQGDPVVSQGPFIADSSEDIRRLYQEYRQGKMQHISQAKDEQRIKW